MEKYKPDMIKKAMKVYAVTDRAWLKGRTLEEQVEEAIIGGSTIIQLREKEVSDEEFLNIAVDIKKITDKYNIPFIINDNIDVAIKCAADGVHVGQSDMEAGSVRDILGEDKILGVSVQTVEQAIIAEEKGADYLGVGSVFSTSTKSDADSVSYDMLKKICASVSIPVVAIGGICYDNIIELKGSKIDGVAVVSAIFASSDIVKATKELNVKVEEMLND